MKVVYHIGLHSTDEDRALRCLLKNADRLEKAGTVVPAAAIFRPVLRDAMLELTGRPASRQTQAQILSAVSEIGEPDRLVFSNDSFLCVPGRAIQGGRLYPQAGERLPWIRNLFPDDDAVFALALRNPATLVPALHNRFSTEEGFASYLGRIDPEALGWAEAVERFRIALPDCRLTIWCNEDSALIWPEILQALSGVADGAALDGADDFAAELLHPDGTRRLADYLASHPPANAEHRRKVLSLFLEKFALKDAVEESYDLPGWTAERVARLTARYEEDVERISGMDGITFLAP